MNGWNKGASMQEKKERKNVSKVERKNEKVKASFALLWVRVLLLLLLLLWWTVSSFRFSIHSIDILKTNDKRKSENVNCERGPYYCRYQIHTHREREKACLGLTFDLHNILIFLFVWSSKFACFWCSYGLATRHEIHGMEWKSCGSFAQS